MLYWMCAKSEGHPLSGPQLEHAIKRNFGGLESESVDPIEVFKKAIDFTDSRHWYDFTGLPEEVGFKFVQSPIHSLCIHCFNCSKLIMMSVEFKILMRI